MWRPETPSHSFLHGPSFQTEVHAEVRSSNGHGQVQWGEWCEVDGTGVRGSRRKLLSAPGKWPLCGQVICSVFGFPKRKEHQIFCFKSPCFKLPGAIRPISVWPKSVTPAGWSSLICHQLQPGVQARGTQLPHLNCSLPPGMPVCPACFPIL